MQIARHPCVRHPWKRQLNCNGHEPGQFESHGAIRPMATWQRGNRVDSPARAQLPTPPNKALFPHWPISSIGIASLPAIRCGNQPDPIHISRHQMAANPSEHFQRAVINASLNIPTDDTQSNTHQNKTEENGSQWNKKKR